MEVNNDNDDFDLNELMNGKEHDQTRRAVAQLVYSMCCIYQPEYSDNDEYKAYVITDIVEGVKDFLRIIPGDDMKKSMNHLQIFQSLYGLDALFSLFTSPIKGNKEIGEESIRLFLINNPKSKIDGFLLPRSIQNQCTFIVLQFYIWLGRLSSTNTDDDGGGDKQLLLLYNSCHKTLISILKSVASTNATRSTYLGFPYPSCIIEEFIRFHTELCKKLTQSLYLVIKQPSLSTMSSDCIRLNLVKDVREFVLFSLHMRRAIEEHMRSYGQSLPMCVNYDEFNDLQPWYIYEIYTFYNNFIDLKIHVTGCLERLGMYIEGGGVIGVPKEFNPTWSCYLSLLKELNNISKLFRGEEDTVSSCLKSNMLAVNYLILHSKSTAEYQWILEHKNVISVESRRNLMCTIMFPMVKYDDEMQPARILIDRSQLLTESFEQITRASPKALHNGLLVEFKNEPGAGNGVLREWLFLVCQALFDPQSSLFLACPSDRRRFFPNPAKMDPQNLNYFRFCGRVIALALMHKVQVGIAFDRVFFLQLAGRKISLEDISYTDPCMYSSWKKILELDANFVDSDAMGLTFVNEVDEFGSRKIVELVPGGNTIVVNSKNREEYVNLLIQHCFVKSICAKVAYFSKGFGDILSKQNLQKCFFRHLELEDLDYLLLGSDKAICVKDWKAHTDYDDVKETDDQIRWFWKVVEDMSAEQQRELLFFWTSVKYLPVNGFSGMPSRLCIYRTKGSRHNMLSSHTCYCRLGLPYYPSLAVMQKHLFSICQELVGHSLGFS